MESNYSKTHSINQFRVRKGGVYRPKSSLEIDIHVKTTEFENLCRKIALHFQEEMNKDEDHLSDNLERQKKAIIGYSQEVEFFKAEIRKYLKQNYVDSPWHPPWYTDVTTAIYEQTWGLSGMAEWFTPEYHQSSSAKIIGSRIYFLEDGRMVLKPQRIDKLRLDQLKRALLLKSDERLDKDDYECYMLDGTRITIYTGELTKEDEDVVIFRRYIIPKYSFEEQERKHTIPKEAVSLFKNMVALGYNVAFTGAVRTAKTTFLTTWQLYEDPALEGVLVETDPEIPLNILMPEAPIVQILADSEKMPHIIKNLLRSDADYFIFAEARDGVAMDTALKLASKGTRRMKITFHLSEPEEFCHDVAAEIVKVYGGDPQTAMVKTAKTFDYIIHFIQLKDKSQKRLSGIYEMGYDKNSRQIYMERICKYNPKKDAWEWAYHLSEDKVRKGEKESESDLREFHSMLKKLSKEFPFEDDSLYTRLKEGGDINDARS